MLWSAYGVTQSAEIFKRMATNLRNNLGSAAVWTYHTPDLWVQHIFLIPLVFFWWYYVMYCKSLPFLWLNLFWFCTFWFLFLMWLPRGVGILSMMLNKSNKSGHPCLILDPMKEESILLPSCMMLTVVDRHSLLGWRCSLQLSSSTSGLVLPTSPYGTR